LSTGTKESQQKELNKNREERRRGEKNTKNNVQRKKPIPERLLCITILQVEEEQKHSLQTYSPSRIAAIHFFPYLSSPLSPTHAFPKETEESHLPHDGLPRNFPTNGRHLVEVHTTKQAITPTSPWLALR
jgi:hypothetical protein